MKKSTILGAGLALAMSGMVGSVGAPAPAQKPAVRSESPRVQQRRKQQRLRDLFGSPMLYASHVASRRTAAQDKRAARKRKNKARSK